MSFIPTIFVFTLSLLGLRIRRLTTVISEWGERKYSLLVLYVFYNEYVLPLQLKCHKVR